MPEATRDLLWLAGLMEGEGCFSFGRTSINGVTPVVAMSTTDLDVAERAARILATNVNTKKWAARPVRYKQGYDVRVCGRRGAGWMMTLWPLLGSRRRARIKEVLRTWMQAPGPKPKRNADCHPNRPHAAKGKCRSCYNARYRNQA